MEDQRYQKPVNRGDIVEVTIEGTGAKGDGIAKVNNFVIIVPGVKQGDQVKVKITRVLKKMAFGEVVTEGEEAGETPSEDMNEEANEAVSEDTGEEEEMPAEDEMSEEE